MIYITTVIRLMILIYYFYLDVQRFSQQNFARTMCKILSYFVVKKFVPNSNLKRLHDERKFRKTSTSLLHVKKADGIISTTHFLVKVLPTSEGAK